MYFRDKFKKKRRNGLRRDPGVSWKKAGKKKEIPFVCWYFYLPLQWHALLIKKAVTAIMSSAEAYKHD